MTSAEFQSKYGNPAPTDERLTSEEYQQQHVEKPRAKEVKWEKPKQSESIRLDIKPLSVNLAWKGRRYRTDAYKAYQIQVKKLLPEIQLPTPPYKLSFVFGFSNSASDTDNPVKCIQDILATHYGFNDKLITELNVKKELVKKGEEFIVFEIKTAA